MEDFQFVYSGNNQRGAGTAWRFPVSVSAKQGVAGRGKKSHHRKRFCFVVNLIKLIALRIAALPVKIYGRVKKKSAMCPQLHSHAV